MTPEALDLESVKLTQNTKSGDGFMKKGPQIKCQINHRSNVEIHPTKSINEKAGLGHVGLCKGQITLRTVNVFSMYQVEGTEAGNLLMIYRNQNKYLSWICTIDFAVERHWRKTCITKNCTLQRSDPLLILFRTADSRSKLTPRVSAVLSSYLALLLTQQFHVAEKRHEGN